jgi:hypothetical protein
MAEHARAKARSSAEVKVVAGKAQCRHRDDQVVRGGNGRACRKARLEADREIGRDAGKGTYHRVRASSLEVSPD